MSDSYIFSSDPKSGLLTYEQLQARRKIAAALATRNRGYPKNIGEGLTALGEGFGDFLANQKTRQYEGAQRSRDAIAASALSGGIADVLPTSASPPPIAPSATPPAPVSAAPTPVQNLAQTVSEPAPAAAPMPSLASASTAALAPDVAPQASPMPIEQWKQRVARIESGNTKDPYRAIGPASRRGDHGLGKYQVMGENVPVWTEQYLGRKMTPQEFLASDEAQERLADAKGGEYIAKYGPEGAAKAWFAGEKGMNDPRRKDTLGTHVAEYARRFNEPLVSRDQIAGAAVNGGGGAPPVQYASLGGAPTTDAGPDVAPAPSSAPPPMPPREAVTNTLMAQQQPAPTMQPGIGPQTLGTAPPAPPQMPQRQVAQAFPISRQRTVPAPAQSPTEARPTPAGPEPSLRTVFESAPKLQQQMEIARRYMLDPYASDATKKAAEARYGELSKVAQDIYTKQWTVWHERSKREEDFNLGAEERQRARETHAQAQQGRITGAAPQQLSDPALLGTEQSPQRTGIPTPPPKPPGISSDAWAKEQAPQLAKSVEAVSKAAPMFDDALRVIQLARTHPGREWGIGATGDIAQKLPWTDAAGFGKVVEQMKGKNFLAGYQQLKGAGPVSEIEGLKTEAAQARVSTAQNKKDFDAAINDLELSMRRDLELAQRKVNAPVTAWRAPGDNSSYAPDIGERRGDKEYIGGNPSDPMSWRRAR